MNNLSAAEWNALCVKAFENLPRDTTVTLDDVDAILAWCLPEEMSEGRRDAGGRAADRPHAWQEYNAYGNTCHYPGCTLGQSEHTELPAESEAPEVTDAVNHPSHYQHPSGVECITVVEHMSFLRGNAIKYLWRAGSKGDELEDLRKARWYLDREIENLERDRGDR